jgi:hypothetical protein
MPTGPTGVQAGAKVGAKVGAGPVEAAEKSEAGYRSSGRGWTNASTAQTSAWIGSKSAWTGSSGAAGAVEPGGLIRERPLKGRGRTKFWRRAD